MRQLETLSNQINVDNFTALRYGRWYIYTIHLSWNESEIKAPEA